MKLKHRGARALEAEIMRLSAEIGAATQELERLRQASDEIGAPRTKERATNGEVPAGTRRPRRGPRT